MTATTAPVKSLNSLRAGAVEVRVTSKRKRMAPPTQVTMIRRLINTGRISAFLIDRQYADSEKSSSQFPPVCGAGHSGDSIPLNVVTSPLRRKSAPYLPENQSFLRK